MLRVLFNVAKIFADSLRELTGKKDTCSVIPPEQAIWHKLIILNWQIHLYTSLY